MELLYRASYDGDWELESDSNVAFNLSAAFPFRGPRLPLTSRPDTPRE